MTRPEVRNRSEGPVVGGGGTPVPRHVGDENVRREGTKVPGCRRALERKKVSKVKSNALEKTTIFVNYLHVDF